MDRAPADVCSTDLSRSQDFYEHTVGLQLSPETIPNHLLFETGDRTSLLVYGRPPANKAGHSQVRFWTGDILADVKALVDHVATTPIGKSAWFKDPDGNTLAQFQPA